MPAYPLVLTRPPRTAAVFVRARLIDEVLDRDRPGAVIVGPAGAGKTMLALDAAARHGGRLAWLRLAPGYGGAADLVGLARTATGGATTDDADRGASTLDLAGELLELLDAEPTVLVIDDYHHAQADETDPLLAEILALVSPASRVIVTGRERPAGLIGRLGLSGGAHPAVIDAAGLAFRVDEINSLLAERGNEASDQRAADILAATNGWATAVFLATDPAASAAPTSWQDLLTALFRGGEEGDRAAVDALVVLPYLTPAMAAALALDTNTLERLRARTMLITTTDGVTSLTNAVRDTLRPLVDDAAAAAIVATAAGEWAKNDPSTAIDLLLDTAQPDLAADVLAASLSTVGTDRAVRWLYRLPAELRHRFPPLLAAGQATVDLDEALADAHRRVDEALDEHARREALLALGSALAHQGSLGAAAHTLESAGAGATDQLAQVAGTWLGIVRWWAGDLIGARSVLGDPSPADRDLRRWARAEVALALGDLDAADAALDATGDDASRPALALGVSARISWDRGDPERAATLALSAYDAAAPAGGFDLAAAAPAYLWLLINDEKFEEAEAITAHIDRRVGRSDVFARIHVTLCQLASARARGDRAAVTRAEQRLADHRTLGFAPIEAEARRRLTALGTPTGSGLQVNVLGPTILRSGGREIASKWKSRKALEVVLYLALVHGQSAPREQIIEAIWPERDPGKGRTLLRTALSEIRRTLEPGRPTGEASSFLGTSADRVTLAATTDYEQARTLADRGDHAAAFELFAGGLLDDDPYLEWAFDLRRSAESFRFELAERVAADDQRDIDLRARALEFIVHEEPWNDRRWHELEQLHREAGDDAAANDVARRRQLFLDDPR